ncbi:hypothetical protein PTKIN_Ptkin14bG0200400 [Pterospermum kingtungense]
MARHMVYFTYNHFGNAIIGFSKSIGVADSNEAEILAVREPLILFIASRWAQEFSLVIKSDSTSAVSWIN